MTTTRAGVYLRISQDRTGKAAGVARQERDCLELADRLGWQVADTYRDNDRSAFKGKRPEYDRLRTDLKAGRITAIVCWHPDRLYRRARELEQLVDLVEELKAEVATVKAGVVDLSTPNGRLVARIGAAVAQHESEHKSERQKSKALELARAGLPNGGGPRPFGYDTTGLLIVEEEAEHIRAACAAVLEGRGLAGIARSWPPGPRGGKRWDARSVKRVLLSPRIVGMRSHRGALHPAKWPGIVDEDTQAAVVAILTDPKRDNRPARPRSYILAGIATCSECGRRLEGKPNSKKQRRYHCTKDRGGCGKVTRMADPVEDLVVEAVLATAETRDPDPAAPGAPADTSEARAIQARIDRLDEDYYVHGKVTEGRWRDLRTQLEERLADATAVMSTTWTVPLPSGDALAVDSWDGWWWHADLTMRRALIRRYVAAVRIQPAVRGRNFFDPSKIELVPVEGVELVHHRSGHLVP